MKFTTRDRDNDKVSSANCALYGGGWWYNAWSNIRLNNHYNYIHSIKLNDPFHSTPFIEVKIRLVNCSL